MLNNRLKSALLFSLVALIVVSACNKDNVSSSKPTLLSFGPSTVEHGDTIKFIGTNLNQITDIVMPVGIDVPKSSFLTHTSTLIELVVPKSSMLGHVVLRYENDSIVSKALFGAKYTITARTFTPSSLRPGDNITITGNFLNYVKQVTFTAGQNVTQFVSQSLHQLVVQVPMASQSGTFSLTDLAGTNAQIVTQDTLLNDLLITVTLPKFTGLSPTALRQLETLTITGTDLDLVGEVDFTTSTGTVPVLTFVNQSSTQIEVVVPGTSITGKVSLKAFSGLKVDGLSVTIVEPSVTAFSPIDEDAQITEGSTLTLTGTDLDLVSAIKFPGVITTVTTFTLTGTTQIDVLVPAGAVGGTMILTTNTGMTIPVVAPYGPQLTLLAAFYEDAIENGFGAWGGWSGSSDYSGTSQVRVGTKSITATYTGNYGGQPQMGGGNLSTSGANYFAFSIYGGPGTGGNNIQIILSGGSAVVAPTPIVEGQWTDVKMPLTSFGSPSSINQVSFQCQGWTGTVYLDQIGLK